MARLRVLHCLLSRVIRQYGPHPTSDLLGVDYYRTVPADTEFPVLLNPLEVFVRFLGAGGIRGRVWILVSYLNPDGSDRRVIYRKPAALPTVVSTGDVVLERSFKLVGVSLPGEGVYAVRVARRSRRAWDLRSRWRILRADYFQLTRAP